MAIQKWTIATLASHIVGSLNVNPSAAGGTVPARLTNLVTRSYYDLWQDHDWRFRSILATLTLAADTDNVVMPDDFDKLDMKWVKENAAKGRVAFTTDDQRFQERLDVPTSAASTGQPRIALLEPKTSETTKFVWQVRVYPTPNMAFTYPYKYLRDAPDLTTGSPVWPRPFYRGWELEATWRAEKAFRVDKAWKETKVEYDKWLEKAIAINDEAMRADIPDIMSNGDWEDLPSSFYDGAGHGRSFGP